MILYDSKKEMIAISPDIVDFLGFESFDEMNEKVEDIADLFVNKPGYIYKFKNFSWIDYILVNNLKTPKIILKTLTNEVETEVIIHELINKNSKSKYYCISFKNLVPVESSESGLEEKLFKGFDEKGFDESFSMNEILLPSNEPLLEEENDENILKTDTNIDEPISINFDEITIEEPIEKRQEIETSTILEKINEKSKIYDTNKVSNELGLDESLIQDLLVEFISQAYELKPQIESALNSKDYPLVHNQIHKLKGAAANLRIEKANEILANTSGIDDSKILYEYIEQFYHFIDELNNELMLNVIPSHKVEEKLSIKEKKEDNLYDLKTASNELGIPEEIVKEFLLEYIKQSFDFKNKLEEYIENFDLKNIKNIVNKLKSSAINLRIEKVDEILTKVLRSNNIENIETLIEEYYQLLEEISKNFNFNDNNTNALSKNEQYQKQVINKYDEIIEKNAQKLGLDKESYKNFINEFINELEKMISKKEAEELKKLARSFKNLAEHLNLEEIYEILNNISSSSDNSNINYQLLELKKIIEKLKNL